MAERHRRQKIVTLSQGMTELLETEAKSLEVSESEILRRGLDLYFARKQRQEKRKQP